MARENQVNCFLKGAFLGGVTGTLAALLLAPKSGRELRGDLACTYGEICEKSQEFSNHLKEGGSGILHAFDRYNGKKNESNGTSSMLMGGAFGAIIGATSALLLAPKSGAKLREGLGDKYDEIRTKAEEFLSQVNHKGHDALDVAEEWKDTLGTIIHKLSASRAKKANSAFDEIIDWANLGIRVLQQLQGRR